MKKEPQWVNDCNQKMMKIMKVGEKIIKINKKLLEPPANLTVEI